MHAIYPGDLRVFHLAQRSEVFVPTTEEKVAEYDRAYCRDLPRRIVPTMDLLDEVFPLVAASYRHAGIGTAHARISNAIEEYDDDPDDISGDILKLWGTHDLKLYFASRVELGLFLQAYEALLPVS